MRSKIQFLKRSRCHLCDEALQVLARLCLARNIPFETIDIDGTPDFEAYSEDIPVLLVDGKKVIKHQFAERQLNRILDRLR